MKHRLTLLILLLSMLSLKAWGGDYVDSLWFDTRLTFHQETRHGDYSSQFRGDHFNLHLRGHLSPTLDYRIRQRLNKNAYDDKNIFNATDMLYLNWSPSSRWSVMAGKYAVLIGNYEFDAAPIDVYYYSKFCDNIYQGFTFGVTGTYNLSETQSIMAQICDSPLSFGESSVYAYSLAWKGGFARWWKTLWTVNYVDDNRDIPAAYIALGNHMLFGNTLLDIDIMNRSGIGQKRPLMSDMTIISKFIWSVGPWNICAKAGYEWNDSKNIDSSGQPYDLVIAPGTDYFYAGCGLEWFPLGDDKLRLHAVYFRDNDLHRNNLQLGLTWRMVLYRRNLKSGE